MVHRRAIATVAALGLVGVLGPVSCGDGRPAFCDDLAHSAGMSELNAALKSHDLDKARLAASRFHDLADGAPEDIRSDLGDLATAVSDIVELIGRDRSAVPGAGEGDRKDGRSGEPTVEQDRSDLNARLGRLSTTSSRVERWAQRNCGLSLT